MGYEAREWYAGLVDTTFSVPMGDRGRLVVPADLRARQQWDQGTQLLLIETAHGVVVSTREQAKDLLRLQLGGESLVDQLIAERRAQAKAEAAP